MSPPEQLSLVAIGNMSDHRMEDSAIQPDDPFGSLGMVDVTLSFVPSMALNAALNLGIAGILARHPGPLTAEEIMLEIPGCKNPHDKLAIDNLRSILAMLVLSNVFSETRSAPTRYGLTPVSKTVGVKKVSFNRVLTEVKLKAWNNLHVAVLDSNARPFVVANGHSFWEEIEKNEDLASYFHESMQATVEMESKIIVQHYDGFDGIETLVDVGGSTGMLVSAIVQAKPHIRGINYDRRRVIASAPQLPGESTAYYPH